MRFFKALCLATLMLWWASPGRGQEASQPPAQNYLMVEMMLGIQGAVIGGGLGVFGVGQLLETVNPCQSRPEDEVGICQLVQSCRSLCLGYAVGIPVGTTLGFVLAELLLKVPGNVWGALLGSMLGEMVGMPQCSLINLIGFLQDLGLTLSFNPSPESDVSLLLNPFMLAALGATLGYNLDLLFNGAPAAPLTLPLFALRF